jgi:hypothetical protein
MELKKGALKKIAAGGEALLPAFTVGRNLD